MAPPDVRYGTPRQVSPRAPHVTLQSVSVNGRCTWGHRLECLTCGATGISHVGSSVSYEDHPPRFAWQHRDCAS